MADEFEYMIRRRRRSPADRVWDTPPLDRETALVILGDVAEDIEQTLFKRRKASPWRKTAQPKPSDLS